VGKFTDLAGKDWEIQPLTIGAVLRVKRESGGRYNLLEPSQPINGENGPDGKALFEVLQFDLESFWEMLAYLLGPEISAREMNAEQFAERMAGAPLMIAQDLFFREWLDFFRQIRRPDQATALEKLARYKAAAIKAMEARIAGPELARADAVVEAKIQEALNKGFGSLLASLESTPGLSASENSV